MTKGARILLILLSLGLAALFLFPTVKWYFFTGEQKQELANASMDRIREYAQARASEDLELLKDFSSNDDGLSQPVPEELIYLIDFAKDNYKLVDRDIPSDWTVYDLLKGFLSGTDAYRSMEDSYRQEVIDLKAMKNKAIQLGLDLYGGMSVVIQADEESLADRLGHSPSNDELNQALNLAMEILNNRIDQFGVTEPQIRKMASENQIMIDVPGEVDPERVNSFLMGKGRLGFYMEDEEATQAIQDYIAQGGLVVDGRPVDDNVIDAGLAVRGFYKKDSYGADIFQNYRVTTEEVGLDGSHIQSAQVNYDQVTGSPYVIFTLDTEGGDLFFRLTSANQNKILTVVMDDKIKTAARINEPIRSQVRITGFDQTEANALALVLRTAAMPVDLEVKSQTSVGASLGADTITAGIKAIAIGLATVVLFMAIWYRRAGLIADMALILNFLFIIAVLSAFKLTLTMTSIAGIILNVGMAVDANVIIFERIKEELRLGKSRAAAIEGGFRKAFWTIMDANITTFIAALFLSMLGSGPVQGFAVTLAVGIFSSLFTAIFVSHYFFDLGTELLKKDKLKIGWGIK
jgi:preprotein translocase subunit SecD